MLVILLFIFLATVVSDIIIWNCLFTSIGTGWKLLMCIPTLMIIGSMWTSITTRRRHNLSVRLFFGSLLFLAIPKLIFVVFALPFGWVAGAAMAAAVLLTFCYGFTIGWLKLVVRKKTLAFADLPAAFDGYRILQISDFHIGTFSHHPEFVERVVKVANEQQADLIVFTGDLINISGTEIKPYLGELAKLRARDGVLSVLGNHDYADMLSIVHDERMMGWRLLMNEHVLIRRGGDSLAVIGVEQTGRPPFEARGHLGTALEGVSDGMFKILLTHDPSHWRMEVLGRTDIQLTLSGHTHAAQMKIGRFSPARWIYKEWGGEYAYQGRMLYVSFGLGGTIPFRLGAWPEINLIQLSRGLS